MQIIEQDCTKETDLYDFICKNNYFRGPELFWRPNVETERWCNVLLPELWHIVCSFLLNRYDVFTLSIPLRNLIVEDPKFGPPKLNTQHGICQFLGAEDGDKFRVAFYNGPFVTLAGHFPFPCTPKTSIMFPYNIDLDRRYLVRYTLNPDAPEWTFPMHPFFTWTKHTQGWFDSKEEVDRFIKKTQDCVPIIELRRSDWGFGGWPHNRNDLLEC